MRQCGGQVLFNLFLNKLDDRIQRTLTEFVVGTKLGGVTNTLEDRVRIQNDLKKLEEWSEINR